MNAEEAHKAVGNRTPGALRRMLRALELFTWSHTEEEWERLQACYTLLRVPHAERLGGGRP